MYKYKCLNPIAACGLNFFTDQYVKAEENEAVDAILVRSAKMHDMEFDADLKAIARAGAGVNNIPLDKCAEQGIVVFNTPGANANGVKELFIFSAIAAVRDVMGGVAWTKSEAGNPEIADLTEKEKKKFVGHEILGKTLGVIGLGAIGIKVANVAVDLGMKVVGYDPFLSDVAKAALNGLVTTTDNLDDIAAAADLITVHVPAMASTNGMINAGFLEKMKDGVIVINLARDTLVNEADMAAALEAGKVAKYVCDFPTAGASQMKNTILIPHLGASTEESEDNCAIMAVQEIMDFLENGNIKNSVNYPAADLGAVAGTRVTVAHKASLSGADIQDMLKPFGAVVSGMVSKTKGDYAYSMFDISGCCCSCSSELEEKLKADGILKVRVISK
ncbi:MAG: 3-phosphoglycerate dehydrogenase family protein [Lachnospiraceae bacterium]|nr:3-phosphoglycerate dehydrogenase family protein [Lachnospiraceae bacterium]